MKNTGEINEAINNVYYTNNGMDYMKIRDFEFIGRQIIKIVELAQKYAYNQAIDDAMRNVEIDPMNGMSIIEESLLSLKKK